MKKEKRLITFDMLQKLCAYQRPTLPIELKICSPNSFYCNDKTCPEWKKLQKATDG